MANEKEAATGSTTTLINEAPKEAPAAVEPEKKLFEEPKAADPKPDEKPKEEPAKEEPKPEPKKEEPKTEPEPKSEGAKPAPIDYESLKLPEGSLLSNEDLAKIKKEAKEQGLSLEDAQGVLEVQGDAVKAFATRQQQLVAQARKEWKEAWSNDPEYGGEKLAESTALAKSAWNRFADNELKTLADQAGFGDHPAVLRMLTRIGRLTSEDRLVRGDVGPNPGKKSPEEILYGKTTPAVEQPVS